MWPQGKYYITFTKTTIFCQNVTDKQRLDSGMGANFMYLAATMLFIRVDF